MLHMAKSVENVSSRRRSLFVGEDADLSNSEVELNMAAYEDMSMAPSSSPAARHINNRKISSGKKPIAVARSSSLNNHRRSGSWSGFEPIDRSEDPCDYKNEEHIVNSISFQMDRHSL